jgi:hypothetical protein
MLIAVHATRTRPLCSRVGHSVAFAARLPPIEHLWDLGSLPPIEHLWDLGILIWRAALMARTLSICLAMDASSAEQHPSRKAAFLPCASRPPDFRPLKTRSGHARPRVRRRANMSDMMTSRTKWPTLVTYLPRLHPCCHLAPSVCEYTSDTEPTSRASCVQPAENGLALFLHRT